MKTNIQTKTSSAAKLVGAGAALILGAFSAMAGVNNQYVYVGNPALPFANNVEPDGVPPLVIMGEYSSAGPSETTVQPLPTGDVTRVSFYGQNYDFTLYALSRLANRSDSGEQTFKVVAAEHFSGTSASAGPIMLDVASFHVQCGDFLAFAGVGPYYPQNPDDGFFTDATYENSNQPIGYDNDTATAPSLGEVFSVGKNRETGTTYDYIDDNFGDQGRMYSIGVYVWVH
jgi:hypothetical protein